MQRPGCRCLAGGQDAWGRIAPAKAPTQAWCTQVQHAKGNTTIMVVAMSHHFLGLQLQKYLRAPSHRDYHERTPTQQLKCASQVRCTTLLVMHRCRDCASALLKSGEIGEKLFEPSGGALGVGRHVTSHTGRTGHMHACRVTGDKAIMQSAAIQIGCSRVEERSPTCAGACAPPCQRGHAATAATSHLHQCSSPPVQLP